MSQVNNKKVILVASLGLLVVVVLAMAGQVESCRRERRLDMARTTIANLLRMYPELANEVNNGSGQANQGQNQLRPNQNGQQQQVMPNNQNNNGQQQQQQQQTPNNLNNQTPQNQQNVIPNSSSNNNNNNNAQ